MSAYLCDPKHIGGLVSYLMHHRHTSPGYIERLAEGTGAADLDQRVAAILARENIASIVYRYPHDGEGERPGPNVATDLDFVVLCVQAARRRLGPIESEPVRVLKACDCYEYQSCEHPEWSTSKAHDILHAIRKAAISSLAGYEDAAWGWDTDAEIKAAYRAKVRP